MSILLLAYFILIPPPLIYILSYSTSVSSPIPFLYYRILSISTLCGTIPYFFSILDLYPVLTFIYYVENFISFISPIMINISVSTLSCIFDLYLFSVPHPTSFKSRIENYPAINFYLHPYIYITEFVWLLSSYTLMLSLSRICMPLSIEHPPSPPTPPPPHTYTYICT